MENSQKPPSQEKKEKPKNKKPTLADFLANVEKIQAKIAKEKAEKDAAEGKVPLVQEKPKEKKLSIAEQIQILQQKRADADELENKMGLKLSGRDANKVDIMAAMRNNLQAKMKQANSKNLGKRMSLKMIELMRANKPEFRYQEGGVGDTFDKTDISARNADKKEDERKKAEDDMRKGGITPYMKKYDSQFEGINYFEDYKPEQIMDHYLNTNPLYEKEATMMPNKIGFTLCDRIPIDNEIKVKLRDLFDKFNSKKEFNPILIPEEMKLVFKKSGLDKEQPAVYSMVCWIVDANKFSGTLGMTFEEFIQYAGYFFTQRHNEEGLKYIFQLFDPQNRGYLLKPDLEKCCEKLGMKMDKSKIQLIFNRASADQEHLYFNEFSFFMKQDKMEM